MKYCKTCKQLCFGDTLPFDGCKHKLREIEDINEPVRLCIAGGTERAMLTGMLKDAEYSVCRRERSSAGRRE